MPERSGTFLRRGAAVVVTLVVTLALAGCKVPVQAHLTSSSSASSPATATEQTVVAEVNNYRAAHGLRALTIHWNLEDKAHLWAAWMAKGGCGSGANGVPTICHSSLTSGITVNWSLLEENVGAASPASNVMGIATGFEHSPQHSANMLNGKITSIGVGVAYSGNLVVVAEEFMAQ
jgi:uncharacterized protein YkwD